MMSRGPGDRPARVPRRSAATPLLDRARHPPGRGARVFAAYDGPPCTRRARVEVRPSIAGGDLQGFYYDLLSNMDTEAQRVTSRDVAAIAGRSPRPPRRSGSASTSSRPTPPTCRRRSRPIRRTSISRTTPDPVESQECADAFASAYVEDRASLARRSATPLGRAPRRRSPRRRNASLSCKRSSTRDRPGPTRRPRRPDRRRGAGDQHGTTATARRSRGVPNPALLALPAPLPTAAPRTRTTSRPEYSPQSWGFAAASPSFVRERLDERIGRREVKKSRSSSRCWLSCHGCRRRNRNDASFVTIDAPDTVTAEAYRTARTTLMYMAPREDIKAIVLTGLGEGEGKTTTTANLAAALA